MLSGLDSIQRAMALQGASRVRPDQSPTQVYLSSRLRSTHQAAHDLGDNLLRLHRGKKDFLAHGENLFLDNPWDQAIPRKSNFSAFFRGGDNMARLVNPTPKKPRSSSRNLP
jgi:hypothetical protein